MPFFDQNESIGFCGRATIAEYLTEIGDLDGANRFASNAPAGQNMGRLFGTDQYAHTGVLLGYIPPDSVGSKLEITNAVTLKPEDELKGKRIKITLDKFYVESYPGMGAHRILCEFAGKNQVAGEAEEIRFAMNADARDKSSASVSGKPIFMGVTVGEDGIAFEGRTVNVRSDVDDMILDALGNDTFKNGLSLISSVQPALKPFVTLAAGVVRATAKRNKNRQVYAFTLGLDFGNSATSAKLRRGSYVVVQGDDADWNWSSVLLNRDSLSIISKTGTPIDLNYMIFGVSDFSAAPVKTAAKAVRAAGAAPQRLRSARSPG